MRPGPLGPACRVGPACRPGGFLRPGRTGRELAEGRLHGGYAVLEAERADLAGLGQPRPLLGQLVDPASGVLEGSDLVLDLS